MSDFEKHQEKYELFKGDAENETVSSPMRIESYFAGAFQLIESCMAKHDLHINKHQMVRSVLAENREIFEQETEKVWRNFQVLENQIRPGQEYGGKINGEELKRAKEIFVIIEKTCLKVLEKWSKKNLRK